MATRWATEHLVFAVGMKADLASLSHQSSMELANIDHLMIKASAPETIEVNRKRASGQVLKGEGEITGVFIYRENEIEREGRRQGIAITQSEIILIGRSFIAATVDPKNGE